MFFDIRSKCVVSRTTYLGIIPYFFQKIKGFFKFFRFFSNIFPNVFENKASAEKKKEPPHQRQLLNNPAEPCNRERKTLKIQGGVRAQALLLPTSAYGRDKSIDAEDGRSANHLRIWTPLV